MKATATEIEKYLGVVSETPARIAEIVKGIDEASLQFKDGDRAWSASDILAHLRSCADLWIHTIYAMLAEKQPVFSDINERKWAKLLRYADLPFQESLSAFSLQRETLLRVLTPLHFEAWERSAIILERRQTVFTQIRRMAKHETEHIEQITSVLRDARRWEKR